MPRGAKSRKRSGTTRKSVERPNLVYFIDRDLGRCDVPDALRSLGVRVELHDDHFDHRTEDCDWIPPVAAKGWAILTKDRKITHRALERETVISSRACYICMRVHGMNGRQIGELAVRHFKRFDGIATAAPWPVIMRASKSEVTLLDPDTNKWIGSRAHDMNPRRWQKSARR